MRAETRLTFDQIAPPVVELPARTGATVARADPLCTFDPNRMVARHCWHPPIRTGNLD